MVWYWAAEMSERRTPMGMTDDWSETDAKYGIVQHIEIPYTEYRDVVRRLGFLEGLVLGLELLEPQAMRDVVRRGVERYNEIKSQ